MNTRKHRSVSTVATFFALPAALLMNGVGCTTGEISNGSGEYAGTGVGGGGGNPGGTSGTAASNPSATGSDSVSTGSDSASTGSDAVSTSSGAVTGSGGSSSVTGSGGSSTTGTGAGGGGTATYWNEPAGYQRISELDFSAMLPNTVSTENCTGPGVLAGCWGHYPFDEGYHVIVQDPTAPKSPGGVFQFTYATGSSCGVSPGGIYGWETGTQLREVYESGWFKIPTEDFENLPLQMKLLGYWGVGSDPNIGSAQIYHVMSAETVLTNQFNSEIRFQGHISAAIGPNVNTEKKIEAGRWHQYEIVMTLNDIGQENGTLKFWLDNEQTHDYSNIKYIDEANPFGFQGRAWAPIYGGGCADVKTRDDYLWIDHLYISGIKK